jgi:hypothetical protein
MNLGKSGNTLASVLYQPPGRHVYAFRRSAIATIGVSMKSSLASEYYRRTRPVDASAASESVHDD